MDRNFTFFFFGVFSALSVFAQETVVKGSVIDGSTYQPISGVVITIEDSALTSKTDEDGQFSFRSDLPFGEQFLKLEKVGYMTKRFPVVIYEKQTLIINDMTLDLAVVDGSDLFTIVLSDDELSDDFAGGTDNISGLLQASQDVYQRTVAFEFSPSFFNLRGLDSEHGTVLINGIAMNKFFNGRPQWASWGGLNDVFRNQEFSANLNPSTYTFGGVLGTTHISTRASEYRRGGRLTYSSANRSYTNRVIGSYATGFMPGNWAVAVAVGKRWGNEGFQEATFYEATAFFAAVEKKINTRHSLNFTAIYTPVRNGKSSPNTQEVVDLKGTAYNEYWGYQNGKKRNSRERQLNEPILMLSHYWRVGSATSLQTSLSYQFGKTGNSRLDYPGGANPSPSYYQKMPSYALADPNGPDHAKAYELEQDFLKDGQMDWNRIYDANSTNATAGLDAAYVLYDDRNDDAQFTVNTVLTSDIADHLTLNASLNYSRMTSANFAEIKDLLGATGVLNKDPFDHFQFDLQNPDRIVGVGERFKYNYKLHATLVSVFAQIQYRSKKMDGFGSLTVSSSNYQREGLYQHEAYDTTSFGKGEHLNFIGFGVKGGLTYKLTGKHLLNFNLGYLSKPPLLKNTYSNPRENHNVVKNSTEEKLMAFDVAYIFRSPLVKAKFSGYYTEIKDANQVSFYYADGLSSFEIDQNETSAFVQEILQGIHKAYLGVEIGLEAQVTSAIKLKGVAALGQFTYANNPHLYLMSSKFINADGVDYGPASLKNYKLAGGPQRAYSIGFEYRDPDYWWFGATANFFGKTYVDINPLIRTRNFYLDADGLPFNDYDTKLAKQLLKQEQFDDYMVVNLVGGKSWKIKTYFVGVFLSINNVLDVAYKTGGFEQGRNADYRMLKADAERDRPVFGAKYWYGRGATYFLNAYVRF